MIIFKTKVDKLIHTLRNKSKKLLLESYLGITEGMRLYEGYIIKKYYSGRKSPMLGLNRQSGTLARSWFITETGTTIKLSSTSRYGIYHDKSRPDLAKRMPKRTNVIGDFSKLLKLESLQFSLTSSEPLDEREAVSHFRFVNYCDGTNQSTLRVSIETGRKHQIRRHLAMLGHPVVGDKRYNEKAEAGMQRLILKANSLKFICPVSGKEIARTLPPIRMV